MNRYRVSLNFHDDGPCTWNINLNDECVASPREVICHAGRCVLVDQDTPGDGRGGGVMLVRASGFTITDGVLVFQQ